MTAEAGPVRDDLSVTGLVTRARNGDQQAWDALVDRYAPLIWSICRRHRLGDADAGDVGQSVWLQLVDQLDRIRDPAALPGWLATTTRRECVRVLRAAHGPHAAGHVPDAGNIPDQRAETAEQELLMAERHAALREAFAHLPPGDQQLITLLIAGPAGAVRPDQRPAGHPGRQHRAEPPPLPGQAAPSSRPRSPDRHRNRYSGRDDRRYPILLTLVAESAVDVLDEVLLLFDQALSGRESAARARMTEALAERARGGENRQALLDDILKIVLDPGVSDGQVGARLRGDIGHERMRAAWEARRARLPRDHGHLAMMDASMAYLRQFVPDVLAAMKFAGGPGTDGLLEAAAILAGLYAAKARKVPDGAPDGFVPARWAGYLETARKAGDVTAFRHYWELCVLMALRDGLRSGDVHVPGSRRYADPASFLLTPQQWEPQRLEFCHLVGKPATAADALALADDELHAALSDLEAQLARGGAPGEVRLTAGGELVIPPLTAEDVPAEAEALRAEFGALLPRVPIASVLVEVDARTGFTDHLVHAGGKVTRPPELKRNLLYVIIAEATNMGLGAMAESCGVPYDVLAWTAEWYFSAETLEAANTAIVNYHHRLPMTQAFGTGTLSSSDGQRFPVKGKSLTARHLSRYFARGQGISTYTHVSDQRGLGSVAYSSSGWLTAGLPVTTGFGGVVRIFGRAGWT